MKLHELSKNKVNEEGLYWLVAIRDTTDWKGAFFPDKKDRIKNKYPNAVIKEGEIVWHCKEDLKANSDKGQIIFDNKFGVNYFKEDFRELTQEEKEEYLK